MDNLPPPPLLKTPPPVLPKSNSAGSMTPPNKSLPPINKPLPLSKPPPLSAKPPQLGVPPPIGGAPPPPPQQQQQQHQNPLSPTGPPPGVARPPNKLPPQPPAKLMTGTPTSTSAGSLPLPNPRASVQISPLNNMNHMPPPPPMFANMPPPIPSNTVVNLPPPPPSVNLPPPPPPTSLPPLPSSSNLPPPPLSNNSGNNFPPPPPANLPPPPTTSLPNINNSGNSLPPPPLTLPNISSPPTSSSLPTSSVITKPLPPPIQSPPPPLTTPPLVSTSSNLPSSPSSTSLNSNPMSNSTDSFSPPSSNRNSIELTRDLEFPEIVTQNRVAEENFNYLKDIYSKITKRSQASNSTSREGNSLAEAFKNYGTMLIAQSDSSMGQCMFKVGDFHRDLETFRDRMDNQTLSGFRGTVDQYVNRDIKMIRNAKKNFDKVRTMYDTIDGKCSSNASKGKGINLVRQAELQQERDYLRGKVTVVGQESATTIKLVNESNSVEMMEQIIEYIEGIQQAAQQLTEHLDAMQPMLSSYKKEALKRRTDLEKSVEIQKQIERSTANGSSGKDQRVSSGGSTGSSSGSGSVDLDREVQGEDPKRARIRRFIAAERNYVTGLATLVHVYLAGLRTDDRLFSKVFKEDEVAIFSNIEPLLAHQTKFLEDLEGCLKTYGEAGASTLGQTFFKASGKFMSLYSVYVGNFSKALITINRVKQSKNFQAFLKTCEEKSDGADLDSLIPTPLTRITSYLIFLQDLKETDSSDPNEANSIRGALDKMQALGNLVGQSHNLIQLMKLEQSLIGFDSSYLVEEGRFLLKEGNMSISLNSTSPPSSYYVILVSDLLIYCKKQTALFPSVIYENTVAAVGGYVGSGTKYKFVGKLEIKNMDIKTTAKDDEKTFTLSTGVGNNITTSTVQFENKTIKEDWMAAISKAISKANQNKIFSIPLEHIYARPAEQNRAIPIFVHRIVDYLFEHAASEEGIFRLSANQRVLDASREEIETGVELDYSELDIHVVACLLKLWVRNLPEPLLTYAQFDSFIDVAELNSKQEKYRAMKSLIEKIPQHNRFCTYYLMRMLTKVSDNCAVNKMTPNNISIVFATLLLRKKGASPMDCTAFNSIFSLIECLMTGFQEIFCDVEREFIKFQNDQNEAMKRRSMAPTKSLPGIPQNNTSPTSSLPSSPDNSPVVSRNSSSNGIPIHHHQRSGSGNVDIDSDSDDEGFSIGGASKASITIQLGEIVKQGYLTKKGAMRRNWTKRWFVLKQNYLFYFKTSRDKKPKGIIQLVNVSVSKSYYKPYCMAVKSSASTDDREFLICATNQSELDEWINSITKCSSKE